MNTIGCIIENSSSLLLSAAHSFKCFLKDTQVMSSYGLKCSFIQSYSGLWLIVLLVLLIICAPIVRTIEIKSKIKKLINSAEEMTPEEFLGIKKQRIGRQQAVTEMDCPGVYVLFNSTKNMYYVGQGTRVISRVAQHFSGHGNGDVYADWKYGDKFSIRIIKLEGSGFNTLNALERNTIATYNAFSQGYNKTHGNRG